MTREELLRRRWGAVLPAENPTVEAAVARLTAVQAQEFSMGLLAAGLRTPGATAASVETALSSGVVRTHVMRPTWHLVAVEDLRWLMRLTADRVAQAAGTMFRSLGLTPEVRAQSRNLVEKALKDGPRTRDEVMVTVAEGGLPVDGLRPVHYLMDAELALVVCNGPRKGKTITYDLVDRRIPPTSEVPRDEALARLAGRYLRGHGPATDRDLSWWSGLGLTEVRRGLEGNRSWLATARPGDAEVWFDPEGKLAGLEGFGWLPAFDEALVAFADRTAILDPERTPQVLTQNGIFNPFVVYQGRIAGTWKRTAPGRPRVQVTWFAPPPKGAEAAQKEWEGYLEHFG